MSKNHIEQPPTQDFGCGVSFSTDFLSKVNNYKNP